jgi:hypothetical protein
LDDERINQIRRQIESIESGRKNVEPTWGETRLIKEELLRTHNVIFTTVTSYKLAEVVGKKQKPVETDYLIIDEAC